MSGTARREGSATTHEHDAVVSSPLHVDTRKEGRGGGEDGVGDEVESGVRRGGLLNGGEVEGDLCRGSRLSLVYPSPRERSDAR